MIEPIESMTSCEKPYNAAPTPCMSFAWGVFVFGVSVQLIRCSRNFRDVGLAM